MTTDYQKLIKDSLEEDKQKTLNFSTDWFHGGIKYDINSHVTLNKLQPIYLLEIGAFEGKSTVWFNETYMAHPISKMVVIDPFLPCDTTTCITPDIYPRFLSNIQKAKYHNKIQVYTQKSQDVLPKLLANSSQKFDIIFIDGSHLCRDVIFDLILSWNLLAITGYLIMDDYRSEKGVVKTCLEFWLNSLDKTEYEILFDRYQVIVRKNTGRT